jgi:hypothetical protein
MTRTDVTEGDITLVISPMECAVDAPDLHAWLAHVGYARPVRTEYGAR